jgi:hypothetical protein
MGKKDSRIQAGKERVQGVKDSRGQVNIYKIKANIV